MACLKPIDIAPLVYFRIVGGGLIAIELIGQAVTNYRLAYVGTDFHFSYLFFRWLEPLSPAATTAHLWLNVALALCLTAGLFFRASSLLLVLGLSSLFLMEKANYINHTYLYCLIVLILGVSPAHRAVSLDVRRRPGLLSSSAPAWPLLLLRFQIAVVYIFAGLAKLNPDWLAASPMRLWLVTRSSYPLIGGLLAQEWVAYAMSYGGVALDLLVIPGLLWRRTRFYAFAAAVLFHLANVALFGIGTFPWLSIAMTALFFPPATFRRLPWLRDRLPPYRPPRGASSSRRGRRLVTGALAAYVSVQLLVPLRPWLYRGDPSWTEAGHNFSWHMMLRAKAGSVRYRVTDPRSGRTWRVDPADHLNRRQVQQMVGKPDMILEFAHDLAELYEREGLGTVEVRADAYVSLNGKPRQRFVDPEVDLAKQRRSLRVYDWIVPPAE